MANKRIDQLTAVTSVGADDLFVVLPNGGAEARKIDASDFAATSSNTGLMLAADKSKLDAIESGAKKDKTIVPYSMTGTISVGAGTCRFYVDETWTISSVRASVGTAPTGAALIVDVNKNGTTIFTTQSNRPQIAVSTNTDVADAIEVSSLASGDYLTVDIDQVGSTIAGADLTVTIVLTRG
jgi:hypothetical protein